MFLLFCDHQDTESESCEIEMTIPQPIFTDNIYITKALCDINICALQDRRKMMIVIYIYGDLANFPYILLSPRH